MAYTEFITGIVSSAVTFVGAYFAFRKDDKSNQLTYVTEDRRKWRDRLRELIPEFISYGLLKNGNIDSLGSDVSILYKIRSEIEIRLNPYDAEDNHLLSLMDRYITSFKEKKDDELEIIRTQINNGFSILLKHDWERVKRESKQKRRFGVLEVVFGSVFLYKSYLIYSLLCKKCLCFTDHCNILFSIICLALILGFYLICKRISKWIFKQIEKSMFIKSSSLTEYFGLIIREKINK